MRPPDTGYGERGMGVWWWGDVGSEAVFVSWRSMNAVRVPSPFKSGSDFSNGFKNECLIDKHGPAGHGSAESSFLNVDSWF